MMKGKSMFSKRPALRITVVCLSYFCPIFVSFRSFATSSKCCKLDSIYPNVVMELTFLTEKRFEANEFLLVE